MNTIYIKKTLSNRTAPLVTAMVLSIGAIGNAQAASCQNILAREKSWLANVPSGYTRSSGVTMVSNSAPILQLSSTPKPEATYLSGNLFNRGLFGDSLVGQGKALFNNREWQDNCSRDDDLLGWLTCDTHSFDPHNTQTWSIVFKPNNSSMVLVKPGQVINMPLVCDGNLMVANHTKYSAFRNFIFPVRNTKYVLSINHLQLRKPR